MLHWPLWYYWCVLFSAEWIVGSDSEKDSVLFESWLNLLSRENVTGLNFVSNFFSEATVFPVCLFLNSPSTTSVHICTLDRPSLSFSLFSFLFLCLLTFHSVPSELLFITNSTATLRFPCNFWRHFRCVSVFRFCFFLFCLVSFFYSASAGHWGLGCEFCSLTHLVSSSLHPWRLHMSNRFHCHRCHCQHISIL